MDNSFVFNESTLRRVPQFLVLIIILFLGLPYIGMNLGFNFSALSKHLGHGKELQTYLLDYQIRGYFRQTLLQWSAFSLSAITVLLAFTQYKLSNDKIALIIGLGVLFPGSIEALHTLVFDELTINYVEKTNLDALIWVFSNSISGLIFIVGLILITKSKKEQEVSFTTFVLITTFLVLTAIMIIYYTAASIINLPTMWYKGAYLSRPYELISVGIYLTLIVFIYPLAYKKYPNILIDCIFYMGVTQIVTSIYLMFLSNYEYDSAYIVAYFLKVITYFIPFACLVINYIFSYSAVLYAQKKLKIQQEELKYIASHDSLTNLFNRREFEELLDKSIANAKRSKYVFALLLIDLDNFKATNDTFGHVHGDELLKQFASRLVLLLRKGDILSRVGGDEFTLITSNLKSSSSARQIAERILNEINSPYPINGRLITVTVSIGISIYPDDGNTTEDLLRQADMAMYKSKRTGKNNFNFYTDQLSFLQHRESEIESHLRMALQHNEFELYFQPKYNLINQEIVGSEVLLRWHNKTLGAVSPDEFIPVAESTGIIVDLGFWVLRKACEQVMSWKKERNLILPIAVNISPIQLVNNNFISNLVKVINDYDYPPEFLEIEITENILMGNSEEVINALKDISSLGIKIALDDFGTEYSSLNRLNKLPIDCLKIDKGFINDIQNEVDKIVIVDIIIKLANELNMTIVAEGIETEEQLKYLVSRNCVIGQGFLMSKPIPADAFLKIAYPLTSKKEITTSQK